MNKLKYLNSSLSKLRASFIIVSLGLLIGFTLTVNYISSLHQKVNSLQNTLDSVLTTPPLSRIDTVFIAAATCYNAVASQCDEDYLTTASGDKIISTSNAYSHRYLAVSRDLLSSFPYGTFVQIEGSGCYDGIWKVSDTMHPRFKKRIDFLVNPDMYMHKWNNVYLKKVPNLC